ncbi:hypothetical protein ACCP91_02855 [Xanthomonas axonopodis pv. cyamopsidis]|uniref:hypothetical protein n=1 Tax=Xanthomonas axonopodis TaxID=53413 RepID=UPI001111E877
MRHVLARASESGSAEKLVHPLPLLRGIKPHEKLCHLGREAQLSQLTQKGGRLLKLGQRATDLEDSALGEQQRTLPYPQSDEFCGGTKAGNPLHWRKTQCTSAAAPRFLLDDRRANPRLKIRDPINNRNWGVVGPEIFYNRSTYLPNGIEQLSAVAGIACARSCQVANDLLLEKLQLPLRQPDRCKGSTQRLANVKQLDAFALEIQAVDGQVNVRKAGKNHPQAQPLLPSSLPLLIDDTRHYQTKLHQISTQRSGVCGTELGGNYRVPAKGIDRPVRRNAN